ncbi:MAG TPA: alpha/beta hydrolase [Oculatellaceae cyanobacterium]
MVTNTPDFILFAQHGWADNSRAIAALSRTVATPNTLIVAPDLGYVATWLRIQPLIQKVERTAIDIIARYPTTPIRIIGHSMGGLIWLELLNRHPEWWSSVESLVLIGSPIGGADLGRLIDPLGFGIGIARDLGINRRQIAQTIAKVIPTLIIAGDIDGGSDGTITVGSTKFHHATFVSLPGLPHAILKNHPTVAETIRDFWLNPAKPALSIIEEDLSPLLIQRLQLVTGMTDAHLRDFYRAKVHFAFKDGITILTWKHPLQIDHVFVAKGKKECLYAGFVGLVHAKALRQTLEEIKREYYEHLHLELPITASTIDE